MKKIVFFFTLVFIVSAAVIFVAVRNKKEQIPGGKNKIVISASFYPLAYFAQEIGGERVEVASITPAGVEAHDYEPSPQDIIKVRSSNIFIYQGAGFDPWAEKTAKELTGVQIINVSSNFNLREVSEEGTKNRDPHIWLDPILAREQVEIISREMQKVDPSGKDFYEERSRNLNNELSKLDSEIRKGLSGCKLSDIVVSHDAFSYFADRYGINVTAVSGISPEEEPSAQKIGEISKIVREKHIPYIFFETLSSPKLADTIASEVGVGILVLNPIEGLTAEEIRDGKDYLSIMRDNLHNLERALQCQQK